MPNGDLARSVEESAIHDRESALSEMRMHHHPICGRPDRLRDDAYASWLVTHPGDYSGAAQVAVDAYFRAGGK